MPKLVVDLLSSPLNVKVVSSSNLRSKPVAMVEDMITVQSISRDDVPSSTDEGIAKQTMVEDGDSVQHNSRSDKSSMNDEGAENQLEASAVDNTVLTPVDSDLYTELEVKQMDDIAELGDDYTSDCQELENITEVSSIDTPGQPLSASPQPISKVTSNLSLTHLVKTINRLKSRIDDIGNSSSSSNKMEKLKSLNRKLIWFENKYEMRCKADGLKEKQPVSTTISVYSTNSDSVDLDILSSVSPVSNINDENGKSKLGSPGTVKSLVQKFEEEVVKDQIPNLEAGESLEPVVSGVDRVKADNMETYKREQKLNVVVDLEPEKDIVQPSSENDGVSNTEKIGPSNFVDVGVDLEPEKNENDGDLKTQEIGPNFFVDAVSSKIDSDDFVFREVTSVGKKRMVKFKGKEVKIPKIRSKMKRRESMDQASEMNKKSSFDNIKFDGLFNAAPTFTGMPNVEMVGKIDEALHKELSKNIQNTNVVRGMNERNAVNLGEVKDTILEKKEDGLIKNAWSNGNIVDKLKEGKVVDEVFVKYIPPTRLPDGSLLVDIPDEVVKIGCSSYALHLFGYFVGINLPFREVVYNLRRMWKNFDLDDISMGEKGMWLFKFKSEEGMRKVLESGVWLLNGVPLLGTEKRAFNCLW